MPKKIGEWASAVQYHWLGASSSLIHVLQRGSDMEMLSYRKIPMQLHITTSRSMDKGVFQR